MSTPTSQRLIYTFPQGERVPNRPLPLEVQKEILALFKECDRRQAAAEFASRSYAIS